MNFESSEQAQFPVIFLWRIHHGVPPTCSKQHFLPKRISGSHVAALNGYAYKYMYIYIYFHETVDHLKHSQASLDHTSIKLSHITPHRFD